MATARFTRLIGVRYAAIGAVSASGADSRQGRAGTAPERDPVEPAAIEYADRFSTPGRPKVAMLTARRWPLTHPD